MAITSIPTITPLSSIWTYRFFISEVRVLTNELDNERVQDSNIVNHLNVCVGNIAELLNLAAEPWYGVLWPATSSPADTSCPVPYIDLATAVGNQVPNQMLWKVRRLTVSNADPVLVDNCKYSSLEEILTFAKRRGAVDVSNEQYSDTVCWHHSGSLVYLYVPTAISTAYNSLKYHVNAYRQPILIDPTNSAQWANKIDLPDRFVRLCLLMVQKMVLEQAEKKIAPEMDAQIQNMTNQITQNIVSEAQYAQQQRTKQEYGLGNR